MSTTPEQLRTIDDVEVEDQRVLLRVDFDVPISPPSNGTPAQVADDTRIRSALVTIEELRRRGARVILVSHLGRPESRDAAWSLRPVAERLSKVSGALVPLAPGVVGPDVRELTERMLPGEMMMLENVRFEPGEMRNDPGLASALADLADLYVDDAFACAHRAYASTEGVARRLQGAAGRLMEREVYALSAVVRRPVRPLVAVLGGADVQTKSSLVRRFLELADAVCVGGVLGLEPAASALAAAAGDGRLELPEDLVLARSDREESDHARVLDGVDVPGGWTALDIGARTGRRYAADVAGAATVFWNGPMGRFERAKFAAGTRTIAEALASSPAITVAAGESTVQALRSYGLQDHLSHVSSGDRASLEFLEGHPLPGIQILRNAPIVLP